MDEQASMMLIN